MRPAAGSTVTDSVLVRLFTDGDDADERLVRDYVLPAIDRLTESAACEDVRFSRFGMDPRWERSEVRLAVYGDADAVVERERERWDDLERDGQIRGWELAGTPYESMGEDARELVRHLSVLGSDGAAELYERFDERPAPTGEAGGGLGVGWWTALHYLSNAAGYTPEEEVHAHLGAIRDRVLATTEFRDYDAARAIVDDLRIALDDLERTVDAVEERGGIDYYDGPFPEGEAPDET